MPFSLTPTTADRLLDLLEFVSLGAATAGQAAQQLHGSFRAAGQARRVRERLAILEAEGLVACTTSLDGRLFRATDAGLSTLQLRGRTPSEGTVLFTDLVGSTALIGTFGEAGAHERRQRHFQLLRAAISRSGGREVKSLGDGLMVVFADAASATECATEMQRAVAADEYGLGLRVGVHSGELLRDGDDFYGTTVIIAARLCDQADGGQIILSDQTRALTEPSSKAPMQSLGQLALKGLSQPVSAFTLWWSSLSAGGSSTTSAAGA